MILTGLWIFSQCVNLSLVIFILYLFLSLSSLSLPLSLISSRFSATLNLSLFSLCLSFLFPPLFLSSLLVIIYKLWVFLLPPRFSHIPLLYSVLLCFFFLFSVLPDHDAGFCPDRWACCISGFDLTLKLIIFNLWRLFCILP